MHETFYSIDKLADDNNRHVHIPDQRGHRKVADSESSLKRRPIHPLGLRFEREANDDKELSH